MKEIKSNDCNLVFAYKDVPYTDSFMIANGGKVEHESVIRLITNHIDDLAEFGRVGFQIVPLPTKGGVQKVKTCRLNKEQATFLITLMKNTKPVVLFKKELVKQFFKMEKYIKTLVSVRKDYPLLTEAIKMVHDEPKPYHFSNEADLINKIITGYTAKKFRVLHNIPKGESIRPYLTERQLELMEMLQKVDTGLLVAVPDYEQRKRHLEWYKLKWEQNHLKSLTA